ncbi:Hypothetical predicted protein [Lecanosticta acicola]|uniref:Uncharacterized protein n=1 Tax=Lecanosticta acicola TaxID=111012 RepID=A0AAI9E8Y3_9PEZI|nr:Hypothetical predicted protein [Lecanosticta acicola]
MSHQPRFRVRSSRFYNPGYERFKAKAPEVCATAQTGTSTGSSTTVSAPSAEDRMPPHAPKPRYISPYFPGKTSYERGLKVKFGPSGGNWLQRESEWMCINPAGSNPELLEARLSDLHSELYRAKRREGWDGRFCMPAPVPSPWANLAKSSRWSTALPGPTTGRDPVEPTHVHQHTPPLPTINPAPKHVKSYPSTSAVTGLKTVAAAASVEGTRSSLYSTTKHVKSQSSKSTGSGPKTVPAELETASSFEESTLNLLRGGPPPLPRARFTSKAPQIDPPECPHEQFLAECSQAFDEEMSWAAQDLRDGLLPPLVDKLRHPELSRFLSQDMDEIHARAEQPREPTPEPVYDLSPGNYGKGEPIPAKHRPRGAIKERLYHRRQGYDDSVIRQLGTEPASNDNLIWRIGARPIWEELMNMGCMSDPYSETIHEVPEKKEERGVIGSLVDATTMTLSWIMDSVCSVLGRR